MLVPVCLGLGLGCAGRQPQPAAAPPQAVPAIVDDVAPTCREVLAQAVGTGRLPASCDGERAVIDAWVRRHRPVFGVVVRRDVDLAGARITLGEALRCRRWPLRRAGRSVIEPADAERAGCVVRPYRGPVEVTGHGRHASTELPSLRPDASGLLNLEFAQYDAAVRAQGRTSLESLQRLDLGAGAWAGSIDLERLRSYTADWHYVWVAAGRGVPALFAHRHRDHPRQTDAHALAVEARLARQERDFMDVERGQLSPIEFLARHAWSPFRRSVERLLQEWTGDQSVARP